MPEVSFQIKKKRREGERKKSKQWRNPGSVAPTLACEVVTMVRNQC